MPRSEASSADRAPVMFQVPFQTRVDLKVYGAQNSTNNQRILLEALREWAEKRGIALRGLTDVDDASDEDEDESAVSSSVPQARKRASA